MTKNSITYKPFVLSSQDNLKLRKEILIRLKHGRNNAITGNELARQLSEHDDRRIRVAIRNLIKEGVPIASSVTEPMGFFIAHNGLEAANYIQVLRARIREDSQRLDDFQKAVGNYQVPEQLSLITGQK